MASRREETMAKNRAHQAAQQAEVKAINERLRKKREDAAAAATAATAATSTPVPPPPPA